MCAAAVDDRYLRGGSQTKDGMKVSIKNGDEVSSLKIAPGLDGIASCLACRRWKW